ncbi:double-strand break repair helicase AddA [Albimonas pacifica]|uniref:DNA 3'-5' helicase n=1 Tax=Albimonas pacifica TaxID=1114924 RepID=A0A1I3D459_9RHOB|nr:double-strand break repair helicase AddA [Albimonas pacifica]SFH81319.1 DNA helicase/exodeoxyribonuclease V, subunit A [Albimonas pacifica]
MSPLDKPPHEATLAQVRASAPGASAWVAANAGSGKTSVLTRRVARLLLDGCRPEKILCLTYTRAAAAEMQARLFKLLGEWSLQSDATLATTLTDLGLPGDPDRQALRRARKLFAEALETPGGLKIQTIHAFCASLLRRFPLESGAPPGFSELDDAARARMLDEIRDRLAAEAEATPDAPFDAAANRLSEQGLESLTAAILGARDLFPENPEPLLRAAFDLSPASDFRRAAEREMSGIDADDLGRLVETMSKGKSTDAKFADELRPAWQALEAADALTAARAVETALHTKSGEPRKLSRLPTKGVAEAHPWTAELIEQLSGQAQELRALRVAHAGFDKAMDLHRYARAVLDLYAKEKAREGVIDFDDLIRAAGALLTTSETAAWALWKLDGGLDHILIDEAQDTSPAQWALVRAIAEEFLAGQGAQDRPRTVFAVGDEKQSIYSFQGAAPREFGRMRAHFRQFLAAAAEAGEGIPLQESSLDYSFRSAPSLLALVDAAFADAAAALTADAETPSHIAFHEQAPGRVDLWPLLETPERAEPPAWHLPVDALPAQAPVLRLADAVAAHVQDQIGAPIPDRDAPGGWRPMRAGDVIVLLRRRGALAGALVDRLKQRGVPVAGADRLRLTASLAVRDLLSLLRVALDPDDDLSTAEVLRSPLGMVSAEELETLALTRDRSSLSRFLRETFPDHPAARLLTDVLNAADYERPHELLQRALVGHGARARIRARLNPEEEDAVDELLARALAYEATETPTLPGFLAFMEASEDLTLKREMDGAGDAVRVMTVHAAKGLEAPFVILADAGPSKSPPGSDVLTHPSDPPVALWSSPKADEAPPMTEAKAARAEREADESLRLLYVALTRARSRLLICGTLGAKADPEGSWHHRVAGAMLDCDATETPAPACLAAEPFETVLTLADRWTPPAEVAAPAAATDDAEGFAPAAAPADLGAAGPFRPAPPAGARPASLPRARRRVAASALDREGEAAAPAPHAPSPHAPSPHDRETARRRGDAIHRLLEALPPLPPEARGTRAEALLAAAHPELPPELRAGCVEEALAALAHPDVAPWLAPSALAEATLSADLPGDLRLIGRVDRLAVERGRLRLLDWKTGPAPETAPEPYLRQMAAYRHALQALHPGAEIEAALFWTASLRLETLAPEALDAALARLSADPKADRLAEAADPPNPAAEPA